MQLEGFYADFHLTLSLRCAHTKDKTECVHSTCSVSSIECCCMCVPPPLSTFMTCLWFFSFIFFFVCFFKLVFVAGIKCESTRKRISLREWERERERLLFFNCHLPYLRQLFRTSLACSFPCLPCLRFPLQLLQLSRRTPNFRLNFDSLRIAGKQQADFSFGYCAAGYLISWCL